MVKLRATSATQGPLKMLRTRTSSLNGRSGSSLGVSRKHWGVSRRQAHSTSCLNTFLSLFGSMPCKRSQASGGEDTRMDGGGRKQTGEERGGLREISTRSKGGLEVGDKKKRGGDPEIENRRGRKGWG